MTPVPTAPGERATHPAARMEDALVRVLRRPLVRAGWAPRVLGYPAYGTQEWVRVFARVLLSPPELSNRPRPADPQRGWRAFATVPVAGEPVVVEADGARQEILSDRSGYIDVVVPARFPPGRHELRLLVRQAPPVPCPVYVPDPAVTTGVVSDVDDTVMVTLLPRPLLAAWNSFGVRVHKRRPVTGMAQLLHRVQEGQGSDGLVVYLSTGAWNIAPTLAAFLRANGFPPGPLLLTAWGPTQTGWFRDGIVHKRRSLERLAAEFPQVRWLLVGDDGQHDPQIYGDFAAAHPDAVRAVAIRQLTPTEQVLARGVPASADQPATHVPVLWVTGPDGGALAERLRARGVLAG